MLSTQFRAAPQVLRLDGNNLDDSCTSALSLLGLRHPVRVVSLRNNLLRDSAAITLADVLPGESHIEELDLSGNDIGPVGAKK